MTERASNIVELFPASDAVPRAPRGRKRAASKAIRAAFVEAVYEASRVAVQRLDGEFPAPPASVDALRLLELVERRQLGLDPRETFESLQS